MQLYARNAVSGKTTQFDFPDTSSQEELENAMAQFSKARPAQPVIISTASPPKATRAASAPNQQAQSERLVSLKSSASGLPTPTPPKPTSPTKFPPEHSEELIVSTNRITGLHINHRNTYVPALPPIKGWSTDPEFPQIAYVQLSTYWKNVGTAVITGPQTYTHTVSYEQGMSVTDSETLSAELGVAVGDLAATINRTTNHSITTSETTTITDSYELSVADSQTTVYILWQLIAKLRFLDANKRPINWKGSIRVPPLGAPLPATFPNEKRLSMFDTVYSDRTNFKT
ncbi:hypothetical protein ACQ0MK_04800 [Thalassospira lucentensis]|uniref:hypothetical protein n=1 Tax=Thalassospira lucentensis TaxID=168935 RepID=UPI003D2F2A5F